MRVGKGAGTKPNSADSDSEVQNLDLPKMCVPNCVVFVVGNEIMKLLIASSALRYWGYAPPYGLSGLPLRIFEACLVIDLSFDLMVADADEPSLDLGFLGSTSPKPGRIPW